MRLALLLTTAVIAACGDATRPLAPLEVRFKAPASVAGYVRDPNVPSMQNCDFELIAQAIGGVPGDEIRWGGAEVRTSNVTIHFTADIVGSWFGAPSIVTGNTQQAQLHATAFSGQSSIFTYRVFYRLPNGEQRDSLLAVLCKWS